MASRNSFFALLLGLAAAAALAWELPLIPHSSEQILVKIPKNCKTAREITAMLQEQGVLRHSRAFLILAAALKWDTKFKSGPYLLRRPEAWPVLAKKLIKGQTFTIKVTVPAGWRIEQIAERLEASSVTDADSFIETAKQKKLEGFLYPSTYFLEPDAPPETVLHAMANQFGRVWKERFENLTLPAGFSIKDVVTLASIIELETTCGPEKPLIAGVFLNRLGKHWKLEADPTVQYALGKWKDRLTYKDTKIQSSYNTYLHGGLPPGPIGNPGADSIGAVLSPAQTDYMYFVARGDGSHEFFRTLEEHNHYRYLLKKAKRLAKQPSELLQ
ncbi:MAG: endolytic transglycosylase MltG [Elusimicrobia bacterium]|nr:endolytic transglycosylase MltG [Elusimicrobiota bacterium]